MEPLLADLTAFVSVVFIDLVLAGDNAIVVGMAARGLPQATRGRVIAIGIIIALVCRIAFAVIAVQLLAIVGLLLTGGLLLLWVAWKMWRELCAAGVTCPAEGATSDAVVPKSVSTAVIQIAIADVSMSLDNVLAVAGAARDHMWIMIFGLILSVALMGAAATFIARVLTRYYWLNYVGLLIITIVALSMIYDGTGDVIVALAQN
ncbi:MAG: TerC family protein [Alphaproteobacteria bacterium]|nr:MAG: TerC family protein [Alphaproteobacteria bacterium]